MTNPSESAPQAPGSAPEVPQVSGALRPTQAPQAPAAVRPPMPSSGAPVAPRPAGAPYGHPASRPPYGNRPASGPGGFRGRRPPPRRKVCRFCADKVREVDYKAVHILRSFMTPRGKLLSGRTTGNCSKHQRQLCTAIKRAQNIALLPFTGE